MWSSTVVKIGPAIAYLVFCLIIGCLAFRKNRNGIAWGVVGGLFSLVGVIAVLLVSPLCPRCKGKLRASDWRQGVCPLCGDLRGRNGPPVRQSRPASVALDDISPMQQQITAIEAAFQSGDQRDREWAERELLQLPEDLAEILRKRYNAENDV